jgi:hypothetical protein
MLCITFMYHFCQSENKKKGCFLVFFFQRPHGKQTPERTISTIQLVCLTTICLEHLIEYDRWHWGDSQR